MSTVDQELNEIIVPLTLKKLTSIYDNTTDYLDLSSRNLIGEDMRIVCQFLSENHEIKKVDLHDNHINGDGIKQLCKIKTITSLNIGWNDIGVSGCMALGKNTTLRELMIYACGISDEGAKVLAQNSNISSLNISFNKISSKGICALLVNKSIKNLNIEKCIPAIISFETLENSLKENTVLIGLEHTIEQNSIKTLIEKVTGRNKAQSWLDTINHARLFKQAQTTENQYPASCPMGTIPKEISAMISDYATTGYDKNQFFLFYFDEKPTSTDLELIKSIALTQ
jgi:Leucine Rich repeat